MPKKHGNKCVILPELLLQSFVSGLFKYPTFESFPTNSIRKLI